MDKTQQVSGLPGREQDYVKIQLDRQIFVFLSVLFLYYIRILQYLLIYTELSFIIVFLVLVVLCAFVMFIIKNKNILAFLIL